MRWPTRSHAKLRRYLNCSQCRAIPSATLDLCGILRCRYSARSLDLHPQPFSKGKSQGVTSLIHGSAAVRALNQAGHVRLPAHAEVQPHKPHPLPTGGAQDVARAVASGVLGDDLTPTVEVVAETNFATMRARALGPDFLGRGKRGGASDDKAASHRLVGPSLRHSAWDIAGGLARPMLPMHFPD
jgi:hypothetical protein